MSGIDELGPGEWLLGLDGWVIWDGNYPDFAVGERRKFALEFVDEGLHEVPAGVRSAVARGEEHYDIAAEVTRAAEDFVLLDFGLLAYSDVRAPATTAGGWRAGRVSLAVDHYSYFEIHAKREGVPPAVYTWTVTGIWGQTAPFTPKPGSHLNEYVRDPARLAYAALDRTDAADDAYAQYLIRCRLEDDAPTHHP